MRLLGIVLISIVWFVCSVLRADAGPLGAVGDHVGSAGDPDTREHSAEALGRVGGPRAVEALTAVARGDPDAGVREHACSALGALGDRRAVQSLLEVMLTDPNARVRRHAAEAIGRIVER